MTAPPESPTDACCKQHDLAYVNVRDGHDIAHADRELAECLANVRDDALSLSEAMYNYAAEASMDAKARAGGVGWEKLPQRERKRRVPKGFPASEVKTMIDEMKPSVELSVEIENLAGEKSQSKAKKRKEKAQFLRGAAAMAAAAGKPVPKKRRPPKKKAKRQMRKQFMRENRRAIVQAGAKNLNPRTRIDAMLMRYAGKKNGRHQLRVCGQDLWFSYSVPGTPPGVGAPINSQALNPILMQNMRMQVMATLFQKFIFRKFVLRYQPMASTQSSGGMLMYVDNDVNTSFAGSGGNQALQSAIAKSGEKIFSIYNPATARMIDPKDRTEYWVNASEAVDPRTSSQGIAWVLAAEAMPANAGAGIFTIEWDIEFYDWSLSGDAGASPSILVPWTEMHNTNVLTLNTTTSWLDGLANVSGVGSLGGYNPNNFISLVANTPSAYIQIGNNLQEVQVGETYFIGVAWVGSATYGALPGLAVSSSGTASATIVAMNPVAGATQTDAVGWWSVTVTGAGFLRLWDNGVNATSSITVSASNMRLMVFGQAVAYRKKTSDSERIKNLEEQIQVLMSQYGKKPVKEFLKELHDGGALPAIEERGGVKAITFKEEPKDEQVVSCDRHMAHDHPEDADIVEFVSIDEYHNPTFAVSGIHDIKIREGGVLEVRRKLSKDKEREQRKEDRKSVG